MLKLKITKIGNSLGVVLPEETLARLKVEQWGFVFLHRGAGRVPRHRSMMKKLGVQIAEGSRDSCASSGNTFRALAK